MIYEYTQLAVMVSVCKKLFKFSCFSQYDIYISLYIDTPLPAYNINVTHMHAAPLQVVQLVSNSSSLFTISLVFYFPYTWVMSLLISRPYQKLIITNMQHKLDDNLI